MKTLKIFILILGLAIISQSKSKAQHFVTSYGMEQSWYLPNEIIHTVEWDFPKYAIVHAHKVYRHGRPYFNLVLQRRKVFLELQFNHFGRVVQRVRYNHFPLTGHICTAHCGYDRPYFHKHAHVRMHHHAHKSKVYVSKKNGHQSHYKSGSNHHGSKVGPTTHNRRDVYHKQSNNSNVTHRKLQRPKVVRPAHTINHRGKQQVRTNTHSQVNRSSVNRSTNRGSEDGRKQSSRTKSAKSTTRSASASRRN